MTFQFTNSEFLWFRQHINLCDEIDFVLDPGSFFGNILKPFLGPTSNRRQDFEEEEDEQLALEARPYRFRNRPPHRRSQRRGHR